jgi:hypothetical protein
MSFNSFNGRIKCCYECKKRHMYCHNTCEDYLRERKDLNEYNEKQRKIKLERQMFNEIKSKTIEKTKRMYKVK